MEKNQMALMLKKLAILSFMIPGLTKAMEQERKKELSPIRSVLYLTRDKWDKDAKKQFLYWYAALKIDEAKNLKELDVLHKELLAFENECRQGAQVKETVDLPLNLYPFDKALTTYG